MYTIFSLPKFSTRSILGLNLNCDSLDKLKCSGLIPKKYFFLSNLVFSKVISLPKKIILLSEIIFSLFKGKIFIFGVPIN